MPRFMTALFLVFALAGCGMTPTVPGPARQASGPMAVRGGGGGAPVITLDEREAIEKTVRKAVAPLLEKELVRAGEGVDKGSVELLKLAPGFDEVYGYTCAVEFRYVRQGTADRAVVDAEADVDLTAPRRESGRFFPKLAPWTIRAVVLRDADR